MTTMVMSSSGSVPQSLQILWLCSTAWRSIANSAACSAMTLKSKSAPSTKPTLVSSHNKSPANCVANLASSLLSECSLGGKDSGDDFTVSLQHLVETHLTPCGK